jgi:hypothetical protein
MRPFARHVWGRGGSRKATALLFVFLAALVQCQIPALAAVDDEDAGRPLPPGLEFSTVPPAALALPLPDFTRSRHSGLPPAISFRELASRGPASLRGPPARISRALSGCPDAGVRTQPDLVWPA